MLRLLSISDFATIDRLDLELAPGFNVLTGETGAGKSLIVDALGLLLGGRAHGTMVRAGAERARVEGVFLLDERGRERVAGLLGDSEADAAADEVIVSREVSADGRGVCRVNGRLAPLRLLSDLGELLADIHGQGQHLSLLRVREHADILDRHAGLWGLRTQVADQVRRLQAVRREISEHVTDERETARRADLLGYQTREIADAAPRSGEDEELVRERGLLANAEQILALADQAYRSLYDEGESGGAAADLLGSAAADLARLERLDPALTQTRETAEALESQAAELAHTIRSYSDGIEYSPQRLQQVEERLDVIAGLKRKYGDTIDDVIAFAERAETEMESLTHHEERLEGLKVEEAELLERVGELAGGLSMARREAAGRLTSDVEAELRELAMEATRLGVEITQSPSEDGVPFAGEASGGSEMGRVAVGPSGADRVEFVVSPNPGEPLRPLARIASGGEAARLMLAVKVVLTGADRVPTLVFDEVDAGVGGRTGAAIGRKLSRLGSEHQVLCVTHLPQIACFADRHIRVGKSPEAGRVTTHAAPVVGAERAEEISQMLGGSGETSLLNAEELLDQAARWKSESSPSAPAGAGGGPNTGRRGRNARK